MNTEAKLGAARFLEHLQRAKALRRDVVDAGGLTPAQELLGHWQTARLAATYADFSAKKRYRAAIEFFLTDLYGTRDFSQRDADIERVYPIMARVLSDRAMHSLSLAVELHALTQQLDSLLLEALRKKLKLDLNRPDASLDASTYAQAYRLCDNYEDRARQIELIRESGQLLDDVVRHPVIYVTAKVARAPAKAAGFGELQSFIERGLSAFRQMKKADVFLTAIKEREYFILDQIFSGDELTDWDAEYFQKKKA